MELESYASAGLAPFFRSDDCLTLDGNGRPAISGFEGGFRAGGGNHGCADLVETLRVALDRGIQIDQRSNVRLNERSKVSEASCGDLCNVPCFKEKLVAKLQRLMPSDEELRETLTVFSALADRTRLKLLFALRLGDELCVCDVAHVLGMSVSAASHHLRKLRELRVLKFRNDGKMAYYSLRNQLVAELVGLAFGEAA